MYAKVIDVGRHFPTHTIGYSYGLDMDYFEIRNILNEGGGYTNWFKFEEVFKHVQPIEGEIYKVKKMFTNQDLIDAYPEHHSHNINRGVIFCMLEDYNGNHFLINKEGLKILYGIPKIVKKHRFYEKT